MSQKSITYEKLPLTIVDDMYNNFKVRLPVNKQYCGYVALLESIIIGAIILIERPKNYGLSYIIVKNEFRKNKIGTSLLSLAAESFKEKNVVGFFNSNNSDHLLLQSFFKRSGWEIARCFDKLQFPMTELPKAFTNKNIDDIISQIKDNGMSIIGENQLDGHMIKKIGEAAKQVHNSLNPLRMKNNTPELTTYIYRNNTIIAWIIVSWDNIKSQTEIDSIYIHPDFRHLNLYPTIINYTYLKFINLGGNPDKTKLIVCIDHKDKRINILHSRYFKKAYDEKLLCFQALKEKNIVTREQL